MALAPSKKTLSSRSDVNGLKTKHLIQHWVYSKSNWLKTQLTLFYSTLVSLAPLYSNGSSARPPILCACMRINVLLKSQPIFVPVTYDGERARTIQLLEQAATVALTGDHWMSVSNDNYLGVTAHFIDNVFGN